MLPENVARFYFLQLIDGLSHIHQQGFVHLDIKEENLLLGSGYQLKIADFGFAASKFGQNGEENTTPKICGTEGYMAPEISDSNVSYNGVCVDLFACAVVLFTLTNGFRPFKSCSQNDEHYRCII